MSKNTKSDLRDSFRPSLKVKSINQLKKEDPNYIYKGVRYDEHLDPDGERIDRYLEKGWEIISSTEKLADDRSTAPKSKEEDSLRPKPMTKAGKGGAQFVMMKIHKDNHAENQSTRVTNDEAKLKAKMKVKREGNSIKLTDSEINENNLKQSEE